MSTQSVTLPQELRQFVAARLASGLYKDESDVLRAALQSLEREEEKQNAKLFAVQAALQRGIDSGIAEGTTEDVFNRVRERVGLPHRKRA